MTNRQKNLRVVGAAILHGGRCLATQRSAQMSNPLEWEFPGGKVEATEDPRRALRREILEELSLDIAVGDLLGTGTSHQRDRTIELEVYLATLVRGQVQLTEHQSYGWFTAAEVETLEWSPADRPLLKALQHILQHRVN